MGKKLLIFLLCLITVTIIIKKPVNASTGQLVADSSANLAINQFNHNPIIDIRVQKLSAYLAQRNSPLTNYAQVFVSSADKYQLDWKLVAAISGVESNFGQQIPLNSYNAWGWDNGNYHFESWTDGIDHVHKIVKQKYADRGLINAYQMGPVYAPPSSTWASKVTYFENQFAEIEVSASSLLALK